MITRYSDTVTNAAKTTTTSAATAMNLYSYSILSPINLILKMILGYSHLIEIKIAGSSERISVKESYLCRMNVKLTRVENIFRF